MDFARRKYGHDRDSNRLSIEDTVLKAGSQSFTYDALNRLTDTKRGVLDTGAVSKSDVAIGYNMDLLGNFTPAAGGIKVNSASSTQTHAVNETNEITALDVPNPAGAPSVISDDFASSIASLWTQSKGTWSVSSGKVQVDTLTSSEALLLASPDLDIVNYEAKVTFPGSSSTNKAGIVFNHDGSNSYLAVVLNRNTGKLALYQVTSGSWGSALVDATATIADSTAYTVQVSRKQRNVTATVGGVTISYDASADLGKGRPGLFSDKTGVTFDDFKAHDASARDALVRGQKGAADSSLSSGKLLVTGSARSGASEVDSFADDDYMVQFTLDLNGGSGADVHVRRTDLGGAASLSFQGGYVGHCDVAAGATDGFCSAGVAYTPSSANAVKIKLSGTSLKVWVDGTLKLNATTGKTAGGVAFAGDSPTIDNLKVGYEPAPHLGLRSLPLRPARMTDNSCPGQAARHRPWYHAPRNSGGCLCCRECHRMPDPRWKLPEPIADEGVCHPALK